jgi:hypothetical protein
VIAAFELQDLRLAGIGAGQADGVHVRLASRRDKAHLLAARHGIDDGLGQFDAFCIVGEKRHALGQLLQNRLHHFRMAMTQKHGPGADQVVYVFAAVLVPDAASLAPRDHDGGVEIAETRGGKDLAARFIQSAWV